MKFFFDRCMPSRLARMVSAYETKHTIRHHDDDTRFNQKTPDIEWIAALAGDEPTWIVVSGDGRILRNKVEREALRSAGLVFFCLAKGWMNMQIHEQAWKFIKVWPDIVESAEHHRAKVFEVAGGQALKVEPKQ